MWFLLKFEQPSSSLEETSANKRLHGDNEMKNTPVKKACKTSKIDAQQNRLWLSFSAPGDYLQGRRRCSGGIRKVPPRITNTNLEDCLTGLNPSNGVTWAPRASEKGGFHTESDEGDWESYEGGQKYTHIEVHILEVESRSMILPGIDDHLICRPLLQYSD